MQATAPCAGCGWSPGAAATRLPAWTHGRFPRPEGFVHADAEMRRLGGIKVSMVERTSLEHSVRLVGRVASAEAATYTVTAGLSGFVRDVSEVTTGSRVSKGDYLATVVAPDAFAAMQSYVVALGAIDRLRQDGPDGAAQARISSASGNLQLRTEKLQDLGISERADRADAAHPRDPVRASRSPRLPTGSSSHGRSPRASVSSAGPSGTGLPTSAASGSWRRSSARKPSTCGRDREHA